MQLNAAELILQQAEKDFRHLFSPAIQAWQLYMLGCLKALEAEMATNAGQACGGAFVTALTAFERARALHPALWRYVSLFC